MNGPDAGHFIDQLVIEVGGPNKMEVCSKFELIGNVAPAISPARF